MKTYFILTIIISFLIGSCDTQPEKEIEYFSKKIYADKSPDGTIKIEIGEIGEDSLNCTTQILMDLGGCGGGVYAVKGKDLNIKTHWKNNDTLIIETKRKYKTDGLQKNSFMQCLTRKVKVVYIEN